MNDERLDEIRSQCTFARMHAGALDLAMGDLLTYVDELTRQRDDARRMVVDAGVFQNHDGTEYLPDPDYPWRADPVGPVAWDVQTEQPL